MRSFLTRTALALVLLSLAHVADGQTQDKADRLTRYFETTAVKGNFSGAILVAEHGKPLISKAYGLANAEHKVPNTTKTKFGIGSVTKQFTASAIMMLQDRGKLSVSDPIDKYLDDIPDQWKGITIHQLLSHTSGLMHSWALPEFEKTIRIPATPEQTLAKFKGQPLVFKPGEGFRYSGLGYFILARVIEKVSGSTYDAFLKENIFVPLGMSDTGSDHPAPVIANRASGYVFSKGHLENAPTMYMPIFSGGGNLYSTVEDLFRWDQALYSTKVVSKKSFATMTTPVRNHYGYGWEMSEGLGHRVMAHGGSLPGFTSFIARYVDDQVTIIVLSNVTNIPASQVSEDLAAVVFQEGAGSKKERGAKPR
ncbi:MAG TPA: serine hydrolase domain-containing protein [Pyrinomonadaceae bacterium]|nr:serine hydrolase domain-containing protein [Pyrinomonadaceae bacterium]